MSDIPAPSLSTPDAVASDLKSARRQTSVYVYEAPVRIWHWTNALAIVVLIMTGYFIGSPPPTMGAGEAYNQFYFGYIRFTHFAAGMILTVAFFGRIYWAFVGNHHAKQLFYVPVWRASYWRELWTEVRWYLFLEAAPKKYVGHNPLAQLAMFCFMTLGLSFMILTGMALYAEGAGEGSFFDLAFGWVRHLVGPSQTLHTIHHLGMWWIVTFMIVHIYVAIREDIMSRQSIVSTMISGHRTFKDDDPD
jgi:Ni/Fe-hydrogenase 1 B-type cytochrome subunit